MKTSDIITELRAVVPFFTDLFSTQLSAAITVIGAGTGFSVVTTTPHELAVGDTVTLIGGIAAWSISSLTFDIPTNLVTAVTTSAHDLTTNKPKFPIQTAVIVGADQSEYNGSFTNYTVIDKNTFTYTPVTAPTITPATGPIFLQDATNIIPLGLFAVTVVTDTTTFEVSTAHLAQFDAVQGTPFADVDPRISGAISEERVRESYTAQKLNDYYAFVVMGDTVTSRGRAVLTDAVDTYTDEALKNIRQIETLSIYVYMPTVAQIAGRDARDTVDDVKVAFNKALYGFKAPNVFTEQQQILIIPTGDGSADYNTAFYVHRYDYERSVRLVEGDAVDPAFNVAWRTTDLQFTNEFNEVILQTDNITMD